MAGLRGHMTDLLRPTAKELGSAIREAGVRPGETLYLASSLAGLGKLDDPARAVMDAVWSVLGAEGTVVMPAFNFGFCRGMPFDRDHTPSESGTLTEWFRRQKGTLRSWAPPYHSVVAAGRHAARYAGAVSSSSFGPSSAFDRLVADGARQLLVGCSFHEGVAHVHWLEEALAVPYRYWKKFEGDVTVDGATQRRAFFMYARREGVQVDAASLAEVVSDMVQTSVAGLCRFQSFQLDAFARVARGHLRRDPNLLVRSGYAAADTPILGIDHVGIVSAFSDRVEQFLKDAGLQIEFEGIVRDLDLNCRYFDAGNCAVEIVEPLSANSAVAGHRERYPGAPLHHIAFRVASLEAGLEYFQDRGYSPVDGAVHLAPKPSDRVCFLSPMFTGGVLIELVASEADARGIPDPRWPESEPNE